MRKIFIELAGGLGNQVFQLAAAKQIAAANGAKVYAYRSMRFKSSSHGNTALGLSPFTDIGERRLAALVRLVISLGFRLQRKLPWLSMPFFDFVWPFEQGLAKVSIRKPVTFLRGYFQASTYLESLSRELPESIKFEGPDSFIHDNLELDPIFVHVRGGDYRLATNPQGLLPAAYYTAAISLADKEREGGRPLWVFTDDQDYAHEILRNFNGRIYFPEKKYNLDTYESFSAFAQGRTIIAANSTFSIASSLLGAPRLTIAPDPPFIDLPTPNGFYNKRFHLVQCPWGEIG